MATCQDSLLEWCCASCLRSDQDRSYYEALGFNDNDPTTEEIRRAYKRISLQLHPDKLLQRGIEVTPENRQKFIEVKEAYDVLVDPRRRMLYDRYGRFGLKAIESPGEINPVEILKNFQRNRGDRCSLYLLIALIFASILVLPVLFCLKADNSVRHLKWMEVWIPMWILDAFLLLIAFTVFIVKVPADGDADTGDAEEINNQSSRNMTAQMAETSEESRGMSNKEVTTGLKTINLVQTVLFVLIQIFIMLKLDGDITMSWIKTFSPWLCYEGISVLTRMVAASQTIDIPNYDAIPLPSNISASGGIEAEQEMLLNRFIVEGEYIKLLLERTKARHGIMNSLLRYWLCVFLALRLDDQVDWSWAIVLIPLWIYIVGNVYFVGILRKWSDSIALDFAMLTIHQHPSPEAQQKQQMLQTQHTVTINGYASLICASQMLLGSISVLLVIRLQHVAGYNAFIILLPLFVLIGCCCCGVFCTLFAYSVVDPDEMQVPGVDRSSASTVPYGTFPREDQNGADV